VQLKIINMQEIQQIIIDREYINSIEVLESSIKVNFNVYDFKIFETVEEFETWLTEMDNV